MQTASSNWPDGANAPETRETAAVQPVQRKTVGRSLAELVLMLVIILTVVNGTLYSQRQPDDSMRPAMLAGQQVLTSRLTYRFRAPQRGEVVVLPDPLNPSQTISRRVVGLPGERLELIGGQVLVGGRALREPYANAIIPQTGLSIQRATAKQLQLAEDEVFLMSDDRGTGIDSRDWGPVKSSQLIGWAWLVYWPLDDLHAVKHESYE